MNRASRRSVSHYVKRGAMIALVVAIGACGDDSDSTLNNVPLNTSPLVNTVSGLWIYAADLAGSGFSCRIRGVTLSVTQSGTNLTGSTPSVATVTCSGQGRTFTQSAVSGQVIANAVRNGNSVTFDISTHDFHNVGTLSGDFISGTVTLRLLVGSSTIVLTGTFTALRETTP